MCCSCRRLWRSGCWPTSCWPSSGAPYRELWRLLLRLVVARLPVLLVATWFETALVAFGQEGTALSWPPPPPPPPPDPWQLLARALPACGAGDPWVSSHSWPSAGRLALRGTGLGGLMMELITLDDPARYFERLAAFRATHWWSAMLWRVADHWLDSTLDGRTGLEALDIGCGAG